MIVGQQILQQYVEGINLDNMAHSLILSGKRGCGKHLFANQIAQKLNLKVVDITNNLNFDYLSTEVFGNPIPTVYLIDIDKCDTRKQNTVLKTLEEPQAGAFFILLTVNKDSLIPTILNRCVYKEFTPYSMEELTQFAAANNLKVNKFAETPGQLVSLSGWDESHIEQFAEKILTKIGVASIPNLLTISDKVAFKHEQDKLEPKVLCKALRNIAYAKSMEEGAPKCYFDALLEIGKMQEYLETPNLNYKQLWDNFLLHLHTVLEVLK